MTVPGLPEKKSATICVKMQYDVYCDICHRKIEKKPKTSAIDIRYTYFNVTTGHHDWGNDSQDSVEKRQVCPECLIKFVNEYYEKGDGKRHTSAYIDIEKRISFEGQSNKTYLSKEECEQLKIFEEDSKDE